MARSSKALLCLWALLACGPADEGSEDNSSEPRTGTLTLKATGEVELLPGGPLHIPGTGFPDPAVSGSTLRLRFAGRGQVQGAASGYDLQLELGAEYESQSSLRVAVTPMLHQQLAGGAALAADGSARVEGTFSLTVVQGRRLYERSAPAVLLLRQHLKPQLQGLSSRAVYLEDRVVVSGDGFLLPGEGDTIVTLEGAYGAQRDNRFAPYARREFVLDVRDRKRALLRIGARMFGVEPGVFQGQISVVNRHASAAPNEEKTEATAVSLTLLRTQLLSISTAKLSRGQRIFGVGAGFLPQDATEDTATLVRLEGTFTPKISGAPTVPSTVGPLLTQVLDGNNMLFVPRPRMDLEGGLVPSDLGATPGRFVGSVTPVVVLGAQKVDGVPLPCGQSCVIDVVAPKQVLYAKFLPNFTEGLRRFGLRNLEPEVRRVALQVAQRTYLRWHVEVRDSKPDDYDEYTTMEVGGPDPNGAGLFGLDNTDGKDVGNIRLNDYIGGFNATAEVEGNFAFGGVFIESFLSFLEANKKKNPLASPRFDAIFSPFIPELGGRPAQRAEYDSGERKDAVREAVRALGTLIGNTMAHEFGHSIGLAIEEGGASHNKNDEDRELMDAGLNRSFEERAELDDYTLRPAGFSERHSRYLDGILPKP